MTTTFPTLFLNRKSRSESTERHRYDGLSFTCIRQHGVLSLATLYDSVFLTLTFDSTSQPHQNALLKSKIVGLTVLSTIKRHKSALCRCVSLFFCFFPALLFHLSHRVRSLWLCGPANPNSFAFSD